MISWYKEFLERRNNPEDVITFTERFLSAKPKEQGEVQALWNSSMGWSLPNPWRLACVDEFPGTPRQRILTDLLFQALDYSATDERESILGFAVVHNSCKLAGIDPSEVFEEIATAVRGPAAEALINFSNRDPNDQSMEAFMLSAIEDSGGGYEIKAAW